MQKSVQIMDRYYMLYFSQPIVTHYLLASDEYCWHAEVCMTSFCFLGLCIKKIIKKNKRKEGFLYSGLCVLQVTLMLSFPLFPGLHFPCFLAALWFRAAKRNITSGVSFNAFWLLLSSFQDILTQIDKGCSFRPCTLPQPQLLCNIFWTFRCCTEIVSSSVYICCNVLWHSIPAISVPWWAFVRWKNVMFNI